MDVLHRLARAGEVSPAEQDTIEDAAARVARAAQQHDPPPRAAPASDRPRRTGLAGAGLTAGAAAAALVAGTVLIPEQNAQPSNTASAPTRRAASGSAVRIELIAERTADAAGSGTAIMTIDSDLVGRGLPGSAGDPTKIRVRFSGDDVNFTIITDHHGAQGVQNRIVDGEVYRYLAGRDGTMQWFHDTSPAAAASLSFPDPRSLLRELTPRARFESVATTPSSGQQLTHLTAREPRAISTRELPRVAGTVTSFEVWVDSDKVIHRMVVTTTQELTKTCRIVPQSDSTLKNLPPGTKGIVISDTVPKNLRPGIEVIAPSELPEDWKVCTRTRRTSTLTIRFDELGTPQTITAPEHAIDVDTKG